MSATLLFYCLKPDKFPHQGEVLPLNGFLHHVFFSGFQNFAIELLCDEKGEVTKEKIVEAVKKAGGANYGTGK